MEQLNNQQIMQKQLQVLAKTMEAKDEEIATLKLHPICTQDIKDKDVEQLKMSFLNVDLKLDILTRLCVSIHRSFLLTFFIEFVKFLVQPTKEYLNRGGHKALMVPKRVNPWKRLGTSIFKQVCVM